jgi:multiple sugar transport system ATP-binding protein
MAEIRLEHLTKRFGSLVAVDDLDLTITDGSFVALLGPSGCGKTTTMNMISGLERPTSGEIYFDGGPISRVDPGRRNVGFVFQNYAIFTHMRVYENLAFGLRVRKPKPSKEELDREVRRVAEIVGVQSALERKAGRLSVNDMQKVALGRSMIVNPAIFLLDEPFSNLDAAFRA